MMAKTEVLSEVSSDSERSADVTTQHMNSAVGVSVRVIRTTGEILSIRRVWANWCGNPDADPDLFLLHSGREGKVIRPHVIVVFRNGEPDCILVGRLEEARQKIKIGYATVFRPYVRTLLFLSGGYLGNQTRENSEIIVAEIRKSLTSGEADCAELRQVPLDSSLSVEARTRPDFFCRQHVCAKHVHRYLELPGSFEDYMRTLPRKQRHEARRHARLLWEDFPDATQIQCYTNEQQIEQLTRDVQKIHASSYQSALGVGFTNSERTRTRFHAVARTGGLRACVMYVSGEPVAFFIAFKFKEALFGQYLGFNPKFQKYSPGLQILLHAIEDSCQPAAGLSVVDLGWGDRNYKRAICNRSWMESPVHIFAPTLHGLRVNVETGLATWLDSQLKGWLASAGFDKVARKLWQQFAVHKSEVEA
jgi:Acetyltransferase (GNAT) domain